MGRRPPTITAVPRRGRGLRPRVAVVLAAAALVVLLAGAGFVALESDTVSGYWKGVWWALSLMTTVGFIGESPETTGGRILSAVLMVFGFALVTVTTAAIASLFVREEERPAEELDRSLEQATLERLDEVARRLEHLERALLRQTDQDPVTRLPAARAETDDRG
ncbi:MAG TPA: potassium channel family protein [Baekduia sp.]|nr:potassium channel family protein [Baekduia sp.]